MVQHAPDMVIMTDRERGRLTYLVKINPSVYAGISTAATNRQFVNLFPAKPEVLRPIV